MLLKFEVKNYKSFHEKAEFSMIPAPKQRDLSYSILSEKTKNRSVKGLCSSVIYGPNASGKTNIIGAMDVLRAIIIRGNIRNSEDQSSPNKAAYNLELIPNNTVNEPEPVEFYIEFVEEGKKYAYELCAMIGGFLDDSYTRSIRREKLEIDDELIFDRSDKILFGNIKKYIGSTSDRVKPNQKAVEMLAEIGLADDELFLTNGFKVLISQPVSKTIVDWFSDKFMIIYRADAIHIIRRFSDPQKKTVFVEKTTNEAARIFGVNSNSLGYMAKGDDAETKLYSIFRDKRDNKKVTAILAEFFESYGTIRFINLFPLVIRAIAMGGTLVVDEFDASIHPMALMSIINAFHNDEINKKHAQLIFNTHNPIFLNSNIFRRDEIKFVEKDDNSSISEIYSLSDFGTSGEKGVRKGEDYMKYYFVGQYGAIKTIDFSPLLENLFQEVINGDD